MLPDSSVSCVPDFSAVILVAAGLHVITHSLSGTKHPRRQP